MHEKISVFLAEDFTCRDDDDADCSSLTATLESTLSLSSLAISSLDVSLTSLSFASSTDSGTPNFQGTSHARLNCRHGHNSRREQSTQVDSSLRLLTSTEPRKLEQEEGFPPSNTVSNNSQPSRSLQYSFRAGNSFGFSEFNDMDLLDLSLHSEPQKAVAAVHVDGNQKCQPEPTQTTQTNPPPQKRQSSLAQVLRRRVETFANNILTIGLLLTGQRELDL
jgi:hypothetical protein